MMTGDFAEIAGVTVSLESLVEIRNILSGLAPASFSALSVSQSGSRRVRQSGRGMEYEESRAYVVGDDVRSMDWRVMARTGEAHTKVFSEQKDRTFRIAVNLSASMFFGTRYGFKSWAAAQVAAHFGWLFSLAGDRLGGLVISTESASTIAPTSSRTGLMSLFGKICEACDHEYPLAPGPGRLNVILGELQRSPKPGSVVVLISDFIGIDDISLNLLRQIARHQQVVACWIHDVTEVEAWEPGVYPLHAQDQVEFLDTRNYAGAAWLSGVQKSHRSDVENLMSRFNIGLVPVSCNGDITSQLMPFLRA